MKNDKNKDPKTHKKKIHIDTDSNKWVDTMNVEMYSMFKNKVWTLVDPSNGVKPNECKWIYKRMCEADGNVETFSACLVAKAILKHRDDEETFSPVVMMKFIRILLAIAAYYDNKIWQMDATTTFLNGYFEKIFTRNN